jgi:CpeT/CpcT family (DUF1001)
MVGDMGKVMALVLGLGKVAVLLAPVAAAAITTREGMAVQIAGSLIGEFDTQAQFEQADTALKVPPSVSGAWLDRQYARMVQVRAPAIGKMLIYLEWRSGGPDGPISRQRIWAFDEAADGVRMRFYTIKRPELLPARIVPGAVLSLKPEDLIGYPAECAARFSWINQVYTGRIDPKDCRIVAQSGRGMRLDVTIRVDRDGFDYQEAGILDSGVRAFVVPPTVPYRFRRVSGR